MKIGKEMPMDIGRKIGYTLIFIMYTRICGHFVILIRRVAWVINEQEVGIDLQGKGTEDNSWQCFLQWINECRDGKFYGIDVVYKGEEAIVAWYSRRG